jgi:nucleotide-binding universal stress UspA family protein
MTEKRKKILLAVDGSDNSYESIKYIGGTPSFKKLNITLFNVLSRIPEHYYDFEDWTPLSQRIREIHAWDTMNEEEIKEFMEKAKKYLQKKGFREDGLITSIRERKRGIARDIKDEADKGYASVIVGRKGIGNIQGTFFGSVASKLLERLSFVPLVVVGKNPKPGKIIIALDGSATSMRAVECVGNLLGDSGSEIELVHVIRSGYSEYLKELEIRIESFFESAKNKLIKSGIDSGSITTKIISGAKSRAIAIFNESIQNKHDTIVIGRRGLSRVQSFVMGRVSNKVIQIAKNKAVWVIS